MKKPAIRLVISLGTIAIIGIIALQVYFFQITFNNEERKLDQKIQIALWDVVEQIYDLNKVNYAGKNPVVQISADYFVVNVNDFIDADVLEHFLIKTFQQQNIKLDFEYAIYDCRTEKMEYGKYIHLGQRADRLQKMELTKHEDFIYYFGIYFPWRRQYILGNMNSIYVLSGILIFVVVFLGYALVVILQQKRFSELQKDVVNNLTHEFKTPLSSILLSTDVLAEKSVLDEPERIRTYASIIKSQANSLLQHIEKVLGMGEIENLGRLNKKQIGLHQFVTNIIDHESFKTKNRDKIITLKLDASDDKICVDEFHFKNLVANLMDNALKYAGTESEIEVSTVSDKRNLQFKIRDNGRGIDKKYHKKIFKKFFRIPTGDVHNVKGFGLGLSYVKDIIKCHGWKLKFRSERNVGTEFVISIPLNKKSCE